MRARRSLLLLALGLAFVGWSIYAARERRTGAVHWRTATGGAILAAAAIGAWLATRKRDAGPRKRGDGQAHGAQSPSSPPPTDYAVPKSTCAVCGRELGATERFCAFDGAEGIADPSSHPGFICPKCGRGYVDGRTECVEDGAELIPAAARASPSAGGRSPKVCPTCGRRRTHGGYCPHDGDRLVVLN